MAVPDGYIIDAESETASAGEDLVEEFPLSFGQQRLWFLAQIEGASEAYNEPFGLRLHGKLDRIALRRALDHIVFRHEVIRNTIVLVDGSPVQRSTAPQDSHFELIEHDLCHRDDVPMELERLVAREAQTIFDLESGPLIRGRLVKLGDEEHVLLVTMHHIVSDAWSVGVLTEELSALYGAFHQGRPDPLPELPIQYVDYAVWKRE